MSRLEEIVLSFMQEEAYRPLSAEELAEELRLKGKDLAAFWQHSSKPSWVSPSCVCFFFV